MFPVWMLTSPPVPSRPGHPGMVRSWLFIQNRLALREGVGFRRRGQGVGP